MEFSHTLGSIGGGALSTDNSPNTDAPTSNRIFTAQRFSGGVQAAGVDAVVGAFGGTTCDVQLWSFNAQFKRWLSITGANATVLVDTAVLGLTVKPGSSLFLQVVANTGVTFLGVGFAGQVENKINQS